MRHAFIIAKVFAAIMLIAGVSLLAARAAFAEDDHTVRVAVASNFSDTFKQLQLAFEAQGKYTLLVSQASSGQLFAQISHGAPFDIFLSADSKAPEQLISADLAVENSDFVYAFGQLVLWSNQADLDTRQFLLATDSTSEDRLALANPKLAPYGRAALETLHATGVYEHWKNQLITGQNVTQTQQFIASGNVTLGFIALSQVIKLSSTHQGKYWQVPTNLHQAIEQKAVLLKRARNKPAAHALLNFLKTHQARGIIEQSGYSTELRL